MASDGDRSGFRSKSFDPAQALASLDVNLPVEDAEEYENLQSFRSAVHKQQCHVERNIPGVSGPGGVPLQRVAAVPIDRNFTPDQGPIRGRGRKRVRNVLTRMDEMQGPLALLRQCRENNIRIKVYTRNHSEIRGILTGYIVAFDKHWNLALRDVDEIFQKKLRCKTPALGKSHTIKQEMNE
ncbi:U7 snRNA binding [Halocaridina rubra]|uniref:U7 snRNA binding n=1 Tax=Halocaridina rubra TaxID=373956 RepID=A0AAN8WRR2_HALRR